jgi:predicted component of type VI protein secretion system
MFVCRLFHQDRPFEQLEARLLAEGETTIGRDPAADWPLDDPDGALSRIHCTLTIHQGKLLLCDRSTNGTFLDDGARAPQGEPVEIAPRHSIRLGTLSILVDRADADPLATTLHMPLSTLAADWSDEPAVRPAHRDASLLEAFCEGAKLDASAFSAEDPVELMRRLGAAYQQSVLGLAMLMQDRARLKKSCQLEQTTIAAAENNPFKWAPTRKLAQDLLCGVDAGFLSGAEAIRASFEDLAQHLAAVAEGANAAAELAIQTLSPETIETEAKAQSGLLRSRAAMAWEIHNRRHAALISHDDGTDTAVSRAFREAYGRAVEGSGQ